MITLCSFCANAHPGFPKAISGECYLCQGQLQQLDEWIAKALELLGGRNAFCLSTQLPDSWLVREEELWDRSLLGETIKQTTNNYIIHAIQAKGKRYSIEAPHRLQFDFFHGLVQMMNEPLFFFGRYKKLKANLSQTRWVCSRCNGSGCDQCKSKGKFYDSVEECIGEPFKQAMRSEEYSLHASGREDVDATNTAGRPFVLEVKNPEEHQVDLRTMEKEIGESGNVQVEELRAVRRNWVTLVSDSHFDKEYEAEIVLEKPVEREMLHRLEKKAPLLLDQQTPNRVAHRRADLLRKREVLRIEVIAGNATETAGATLRITAEAGTYIKEFVTGDAGRTKPSVSEMLGVPGVCKNLVVTKIYDEFLELVG